MNNLPIYEVLDYIKSTFKTNNTLILEAPPGAGKSTVVPISFLDQPWLEDRIIIMLEPRRVAARAVAKRMAAILGEETGQSVGYIIKNENCRSANTKILVVTEAILVRMLQRDQSLENTAMIIFDEFHERSIHTDLSLALSLQVQELLRDDLKILIMSATLDSKELLYLLGNVPVITSQGYSFEVENVYLEPNIKHPDKRTINTVLLNTVQKSLKNDTGDILVFLAGAKEIMSLYSLLKDKIEINDVQIYLLYSGLSKKEQQKALEIGEKRKIILSTNIAQTSLTIEGVEVVIDTGLEKLSRYNYSNGMNHLELQFISLDSATQRAGRAGRLSNGKCYRLWHKHKILQNSTQPEILRSDISSLLLDLSLWGVDDLSELKWLDLPNNNIIENTKKVLEELQMIDKYFNITKFGREALSLGVHPRLAFMILKSVELNCSYEGCLLASILTEQDIFINSYNQSDIRNIFLDLHEKNFQNIYINKNRADNVLKQAVYLHDKLLKLNKKTSINTSFNKDMIAILVLFAYPDRLARRRQDNDTRYKLSNGKGALLNIEDSLFNEEFLVVPSLSGKNKDSYINRACSICLNDIEEYFSYIIDIKEDIYYNKNNKKFELKEHHYFLNLELKNNPLSKSNYDFKSLVFKLIQNEGLEILKFNNKAKGLKERVVFANNNFKESVFPDFADDALADSLELWLEPYLENINSIKELENLDIYSILSVFLGWEQMQLLDRILPLYIKVPSGSNIKIDYSDIDKPVLKVKIQELFGMDVTPRILNGSMPLQIHLLTPAFRPIQITNDLKSFWENSYEEVAKELRGKYKKHYWPKNPYEAIATNKTKAAMGDQKKQMDKNGK